MKKSKLAAALSVVSAAALLAGCGDTVEESTQQSSGSGSGNVQMESSAETEEDFSSEESENTEEEEVQGNTDTLGEYTAYSEYEYDADGRLTKQTDYVKDGEEFTIDQAAEYEYNTDGNIVKFLLYSGEEAGLDSEQKRYIEWQYDDHGNVLSVARTGSFPVEELVNIRNNMSLTNHWECDQEGNLSAVYAEGQLHTEYEYRYDENGSLVWEAGYRSDVNGVWHDINNLWRDEAGRIVIVESLSYNAPNKNDYYMAYDAGHYNADYFNSKSWQAQLEYRQHFIRTYYEYDEMGRVVQMVRAVSSGTGSEDGASISEYEYDESGNKVKELRYRYDDYGMGLTLYREGDSVVMNGMVGGEKRSSGWTEWEYNADGKVIKETEYTADDQIVSVQEWEYDAKGNLAKYTGANGHAVEYQWYEDGRLKSRTTAGNNSFLELEVYDRGGRKIVMPYTEAVEYDDAGMPVGVTAIEFNRMSDMVEVHYEFVYDENGYIYRVLK